MPQRFMLLIAVCTSTMLTPAPKSALPATKADEKKTEPQHQTLDERLLFSPQSIPSGIGSPKIFSSMTSLSNPKIRLAFMAGTARAKIVEPLS